MKLFIGLSLGVFYAVLVTLAFGASSRGWQAGHSDLGFWWAVIGALLAVAGTGAVLGTWLHARPSED
jgi:hypothetical protein